MDKAMELAGYSSQTTDQPGRAARRDNLYVPREDGAEYSSLPGSSRKTSLLLEAQLHPVATMTILAGVGLGLASLLFGPGLPRGRHGHDRALARRTANGQGRPAPDGRLDEGVRPAGYSREASARS
jgi:hypothetical protein